jgi:hypothetical protein
MKSKNQTTVLMTVLAAILALTLPALSEENPADDMQILVEKLRADKKLLVAKTLELTESEAKAFWPIYESFQDGRSKLAERLIKGIREYAEKYGKISDEETKKLRIEYLAIKFGELRLMESYLPKFEEVLPEKKVFRYFHLERKIEGELEALLGQVLPLIQ